MAIKPTKKTKMYEREAIAIVDWAKELAPNDRIPWELRERIRRALVRAERKGRMNQAYYCCFGCPRSCHITQPPALTDEERETLAAILHHGQNPAAESLVRKLADALGVE